MNISLPSPVSGRVIESIPAMETAPEIINQDPYGAGWLAVIEATEGDVQMKQLLIPQHTYDKIKLEAEQEVRNE